MAASWRFTQRPRLCFIVCVSAVFLLLLFSQALRPTRQEQRHKRDFLESTELPAEHIDPAAIDLTPLVNTLINSSQSGSRQLFSLLSVTSYSSLALHKLTLLVYNISSIRNIESNKFRRRFCYCVTNETNDLTDFTAILLDVMGNSTSYLHELFKSASILSVSQRNNSDCIYICVMAGKKDREVPELWQVDSITPLFNQTIVEGPHRVANVSSFRLPVEWHQLPTNLTHMSPSGMSSMLTSRVHSTAHASPATPEKTAATTQKVPAARPLATARQPATFAPQTTAESSETTQAATTERFTTQRATTSTVAISQTQEVETTTITTSKQPATTVSIMTAAALTTVPAPSTTATQRPTTTTAQPITATRRSTTATPRPTTATPRPTTATPRPTTATPRPTTATPPPITATPRPTTATPPATTAALPSSTVPLRPTTATPPPITATLPPTTATPRLTTATAQATTTTSRPITATPRPTTAIPLPTTTTSRPITATALQTTATLRPITATPRPTTTTSRPITRTPRTTTATTRPTTATLGPTTIPPPLTTVPPRATTFSPAISLFRVTTSTSAATHHTTSTVQPTRLSPTAAPTAAIRTTGPPGRRTTTPSRLVEAERPGCPWRRPEPSGESESESESESDGIITVSASKLQPCVLELCKFFSTCLCRPFSHKTRMKRYCDDSHLWYEKHTLEVCRRVRRVSFSRNLKQRCLTKMCNKL